MRSNTITLFSRVELPEAKPSSQPPAGPRLASLLNTEIAALGYTMERRLAGAFAALPQEQFLSERSALLANLSSIKGASSRHATLYRNFPYEREDTLDYLRNWALAIVGRDHEIPALRLRLSPEGYIFDMALLLGGDDDALPDENSGDWMPYVLNLLPGDGDGLTEDGEDSVRHRFASVTPLTPLMLADPAFVARKARELMLRAASLSSDEATWLRAVPPEAGHAAVDALVASGSVFRETLPIAYALARDPLQVSPLLVGATDVLRIAASLSAPDADLSLAAPTRFKLSTSNAKGMLGLLQALDSPNIAEDMLRHRERWLRLGEVIHPGTARNRARYPRVAEAFDALRRTPGLIPSHNRTVEAATRTGAIDPALVDVLKRRPGDFLRRLDVLLRTARDPEPVLRGLEAVAGSLPTKALFEMRKYLQHRAEGRTGDRVFLPKGQANRMQIKPDNRAAIPAEVLAEARGVLQAEIALRCAELPPMPRVYLDPALRQVVMPYNTRGDSATTSPVSKGSRFPIGDADVSRLFIHWTGQDVDLSVLFLDADLQAVDQVSFTNTQVVGCKHSGDVRYAPNGGSEFIDIHGATLLERGIRYAVMSVISFAGGNFKDFPCYAGYMQRDSLTSGQKFEPASVQLKFDMDGEGTSCLPLILDLAERQLIYADILSGKRSFATVEDSSVKLRAQVGAMLAMPDTKPTAWDVLEAHVTARGTLVSDLDGADNAYMASGIDLEWLQTLVAMPAPGTRDQDKALSPPAP